MSAGCCLPKQAEYAVVQAFAADPNRCLPNIATIAIDWDQSLRDLYNSQVVHSLADEFIGKIKSDYYPSVSYKDSMTNAYMMGAIYKRLDRESVRMKAHLAQQRGREAAMVEHKRKETIALHQAKVYSRKFNVCILFTFNSIHF